MYRAKVGGSNRIEIDAGQADDASSLTLHRREWGMA
jgi:hypothetical protein